MAKWVVERCCRDTKCGGAWFAMNTMTHHIADDGGDMQGVFPTQAEAQAWCDKANAENLPITRA